MALNLKHSAIKGGRGGREERLSPKFNERTERYTGQKVT
jgi:hypothetical protein